MAITVGGNIKIVMRQTYLGQRVENVQWYRTDGAAFLTADAAAVGEAWWNDVKTVWRSMIVNSSAFTFDEVFVEEEDPSGAFGTFPVPSAERNGTRALGTLGDFLPPFVAAGVRLTVATRITRPGQKRFTGLMEGDQVNGQLAAGYLAFVGPVANRFSEPIILGAPVATGALQPVIIRFAGSPATNIGQQDVTGHLVSTYVTSQVSRKVGRGI